MEKKRNKVKISMKRKWRDKVKNNKGDSLEM